MSIQTIEKDFSEIPVIDISGLYSADPADQQQVAIELGKAAEHVGFLYIKGHRIPRAHIEALQAQAKAFFALPFEDKMPDDAGKFGIKHRG